MTALLFKIGKFALGLYLGYASVGSTYGAAGSLLVILVWIYYSAQILFFGAEFTQVWAANRAGKTTTDSDKPAESDGRPPNSVWATVAAALVIAWAARKDRTPISPR